jgi:hypothetical protein
VKRRSREDRDRRIRREGHEWAYDRTSEVGKLDKALDEAALKGWTVVDMKRDWNKIFR